MQLLFYLNLLLIYVDITFSYVVFILMKEVYEKNNFKEKIFHNMLIILSYAFDLVFTGVITCFFKFHLKLVFTNSTTIESLEKEHQNENLKFRLSLYENFIQVFGENKLLWFIPYVSEKGRPCGDGLTWKTTNIAQGVIPQANEMQNYSSDNPLNN
ncbi:MAG: hypothetical protein MJ252_06330 [archaeon]|nr:hypothetical protein [archaeon]